MKGRSTFTKAEADEIVKLIKKKLSAGTAEQKGIRAKIRVLGFYASDFGLSGGYTERDFLRVVKIIGGSQKAHKVDAVAPINKAKSGLSQSSNKADSSDECYIIDLCDQVLNRKASRQHRFDFLLGDAGTRLPVDAYYSDIKLVIEYKERQHTEPAKFFDRRDTVSGVGRGEQRKLYDQRRRTVLPIQGISLIEFNYDKFDHTSSKRLRRNRSKDSEVLRTALSKFI
ncbi:hypothetical protein [Chryseolinea sp. H1M3-3]|uniref:hypothetical protein n=1 Tax=Chryseolinea sp. H1M3-3 TaxID=3034144 RepID=UPI0023ECABCB|nr:hypothetical protein [Chryseolinea sp. H1M3-3]